MKKCSKCKIKKPYDGFGRNKSMRDGYATYCKDCMADYAKSDKRRASKAKWKLKDRYGITPEEYDAMLVKQEYRCSICGIHNDDLHHSLCVDHDHTTEAVRGLLCKPCNLALGNMRDNPKLLHKAAEYLEELGY